MNKYTGLLVCALLAPVAGCSRDEPAAPPVATPTVTLNKDKAALGSPLKITYKFDVAQNATFDADYLVFLHSLEPDGERIWQDDHPPPVPTSQWKPGQTIEYTRTIFVPNYPYLGEANLHIGLYNPATGRRLPLNAPDAGSHAYVVGKLEVLPSSENIFLIYKDGWHPAEVDPNNPATEWQWTKKVATISFRNPRRDGTLYLDYDARTDQFTPPQQVTISMAGKTLATFAADSKDTKLLTFPIGADQFGPDDMSELVLEVDRTFSAPGDSRELGIRIFHAFIEPR
jgi:hypothetical protein